MSPLESESPQDGAARRGRRLRDASLVAGVMVLSSLLGLARDLVLAALFGDSEAADAFFVAWTLPETVTPLVSDSGLGLVLVPMFARAWSAEGSLTSAIRRTLLPAVVLSLVVGATAALAAPLIVGLLAPGLAQPALATMCVRWASVTVVGLGLAGYLESALRGRGSYVRPAFMYVAYNVGILGCLALTPLLGVRAAALGLAVGSLLMLVVLWPAVIRSTDLRSLRWPRGVRVASYAIVLPLVVYSLGRQGQVFAERYFGSSIPGAISQLNYAAKVAQIPAAIAELFAVVTVSALAAHLSEGREADARAEVHAALRNGLCVVVPSTVGLVVLAPGVIRLLLGRGAFAGEASEATANVMRWYAIGLPGQFLVGAAVLFLCTRRGGARTAAGAALGCLVVTVVCDVLVVDPMGPAGLALGNAVGITIAAAILLHRMHRDVVSLSWGALAGCGARSALSAAGAGLLAWVAVLLLGVGVASTLVAGIGFLAAYVGLAYLLGLEEARASTVWVGRRLRRRREPASLARR